MALITTRESGAGVDQVTVKNSPLTNAEVDQNFINLNAGLKTILGPVKNVSGTTLAKGTPVYQIGSVGNLITVGAADAANPSKMPAIGVLNTSLADQAESLDGLLFLGFISGVNTASFNAGDEIYVAAGGGYTNVRPTNASGNLIQFLGIVDKIHASNGSGIVLGTGTAATQSVEKTDDIVFNSVEAAKTSNYEITTSDFPKIRPSLSLDFANAKSVDSRITFTRVSAATYYDDKGVLKLVRDNKPRIDFDPNTGECKGLLIEEQRTNLLTYGEQFNNAAWFKTRSSITANSATSPDGTANADALIESTENAAHYMGQSAAVTNGAVYTFSIFAKSNGTRNWLAVFVSNATATGDTYFNIANGTLGNVSSNASASITSYGNGWYRCTVTFTTASTTIIVYPIVGIANNSSSYAGDGTSGILVWGAQLEAGSFATSYIPSRDTFTSRASSATYFDKDGVLRIAGINQPRYGYAYDSASGKWISQGLVLEASATNISPVTVAGFYTNQGLNINTNAALAPDNTLTAVLLSENSTSSIIPSVYYPISGPAQSLRCVSVYAKKGPGNRNMRFYWDGFSAGNTGYVIYDLTNGTAALQGINTTYLRGYGIESVGNGWYRCWFSGVPTSSEPDYYVHIDALAGTSASSYTNVVGNGIYVWGLQMEYSATPSSYIYNPSGATTRAADVSSSATATRAGDQALMSGTNFTSWYNYAEGTMYGESALIGRNPSSPGYTQGLCSAVAGSYSEGSVTLMTNSGGNTYSFMTVWHPTEGNSVGINSSTAAVGTQIKLAGAYKENDFAFAKDGTLSGTDTSGKVPQTVYRFRIGTDYFDDRYLNGWLKRIAYYPKRLSNTELQALTK